MPKKIIIPLLLLLFLAALAFRVIYSLFPPQLNGDTAVCALMAKHILELRHFPVYMYRAHYGGTLPSYIGAFLFRLFGVSTSTYFITGILFSCGWVLFTIMLAKRLLNYYGFIAALVLVLFPPVQVLAHSLNAGAAHAEGLLFGSLLLLLLFYWKEARYPKPKMMYLGLGFFCGLAMWSTPSATPFLLTVVTVYLLEERKRLSLGRGGLFLSGFLLGYLPAIIYNVQYPGLSLFRMAGKILDLDRSVLASPQLVRIVMERVIWRLSTVPLSLMKILPLLFSLQGALNSLLFLFALVFILKEEISNFSKDKRFNFWGIMLIFVLFFILFYALFIGTDTPRYMLPLYAVAPIFIGRLLSKIARKSRPIFIILFICILMHNTYQIGYSLMHKNIFHYRQLVEWLSEKGFRYGYSDYWTSYPVMFESKEEVLLSPTIFSPDFSDRYPEYTRKVRMAENPVYVITHAMYPDLTTVMEKQLASLKINYKKDVLGEFSIYHAFSRKVYPEEFDWEGFSPKKITRKTGAGI